jgi:predicted nucleotidyltransferase
MLPLIETHRPELSQLCKQHHVHALYLFGSATSENFNNETSDIDFAVEFSESASHFNFAANYFSFLEQLEKLFGRKVDLLSYNFIKNPVIKQEIESSKIELYAA